MQVPDAGDVVAYDERDGDGLRPAGPPPLQAQIRTEADREQNRGDQNRSSLRGITAEESEQEEQGRKQDDVKLESHGQRQQQREREDSILPQQPQKPQP